MNLCIRLTSHFAEATNSRKNLGDNMLSRYMKIFYCVIALFPFGTFSFFPLICGSFGASGLLFAFAGIVLLDVFLSMLFLRIARCKVPNEPVKLSGLEVNDVDFLVAAMTYLIPFSTLLLSIEDADMLVMLALNLTMCMLLAILKGLRPSPFLLLLGYHCYKASIYNGVGGCLLITKKKIKNPKEVKYVIPIFDYAYLE